AALLPRNAEHLGRILLETGVITHEVYDQSLRRLAESGMRQGEILIEMGAITDEQLTQALKLQLRRKLTGLFGASAGEFAIYVADHQYGRGDEAAQMRVHPRRIIYHGVRHRYDDTRLDLEAAALEGRRVRLRADAARSLDRYGFEDDDLALVSKLGERAYTIDELTAATELDRTVVRMILYTLYITEALEVDEDVAAAVGPPPVAAPAILNPPRPAPSRPAPPRPAPPRPAPPPAAAPARAAAAPAAAPARNGSFTSAHAAGSTPAAAAMSPAARETLRRQIEAKAKDIDTATLFQVLGVEQTASKEAVREAYLELAKTFHPDRLHGGDLESLRPLLDTIFARVSEAHATLMDDERRRGYVQSLSQGGDLNRGQRILEAEVAFQKGSVFLKRKDFAHAVVEFKRAVSLNADEGEHHAALAWALWQGAPDKSAAAAEAKAMLAKAIDLAPRCTKAHFYRAEISMALGAEAEALTHYRRVLALDDNHIDAQRAVRLLVARLEKKEGKKGGLFDRLRRK
ncbi:MAG TPA: DnaJ domain-containing protein, partial [Polyangia bacterium]